MTDSEPPPPPGISAAHWLQVDMAASGCVSGTLSEWPVLASALRALGHDLPPETPASKLRNLCRDIYDENENANDRV